MARGGRDGEEELTADLVELARQYGRYGYRKISVPARQPKRGWLWLGDGFCIRLRPERRNHVWVYDFVEERTHDGRKFRTLDVVDEFTLECLAIRVSRKLDSTDVIDVRSDLFILRGVPDHIRPTMVRSSSRRRSIGGPMRMGSCSTSRGQANRPTTLSSSRSTGGFATSA